MTKVKFAKISFWVILYIISFGFILPELFSAKSNTALACGVLLILILFYRFISIFNTESIKNIIKELFKN